MTRRAAAAHLALLLTACASAPPPPPPPPPPEPERAEAESPLPALPAPLTRMSPAFRELWRGVHESFEVGLLPPTTQTARGLARWAEQELSPWIARRMEILVSVRDAFGAISDPYEKLVAAVSLGYAFELFAHEVRDVPVPEEVAGEPELAAVFTRELEATAAPMLARVRALYSVCGHMGAIELTAWRQFCEARAATLPAAEVTAEAPPSRPPPAPRPPECLPPPASEPPAAPSGSRLVVAVLPGPLGFLVEEERAAIVAAVTERLAADGLSLVPAREVSGARAAADAFRSRARGPRCGRAPDPVGILVATHPGLVVARVSAGCEGAGSSPRCGLRVIFSAEDGARDDVPAALEAWLDAPSTEPSALAGLAPRLAPSTRAALFGAPLGFTGATGPVAVAASAAYGSFAEEAPGDVVLAHAGAALAACRDRDGSRLRAADLALRLRADGTLDALAVEEVPRDPASRACVRDALGGLAFAPSGAEGAGPRRLALTLLFAADGGDSDHGYDVRAPRVAASVELEDALTDFRVREALLACHAGAVEDPYAAVASYRLRLRVDPRGRTSGVTVDSVTPPPDGDEALARCLEGALRGLTLGCPADGRALEAEALLCLGG